MFLVSKLSGGLGGKSKGRNINIANIENSTDSRAMNTCHIFVHVFWPGVGGGGVLPYMGYIGMCGPKEYGFSAVLVTNRVSSLADSDSGHK